VFFAFGNSLAIWIPTILIAGIGSNIGTATSQAILQAKVSPNVQGRVFSSRRLLTWFPDSFTPILGGLLADQVMEPVMLSENWFSNIFRWIVGTKPGSGMALMMICFGMFTILTMVSGYIIPGIRNMEDILPDYDEKSAILSSY
jgi:hypothetical protein